MFLSLKHNLWEKFHAVFSEYHSYTPMIKTTQLMNTHATPHVDLQRVSLKANIDNSV